MLADFPFPSSSLPFADLINAYTSGRAINPGRTRSLHARIIIAGAAKSPHLASKLIAFYAACKQFGHARKVFDEIPKPSGTRIWAALIGSYARHGLYPESITSFSEMRKEEKLNHDRNITLSILKACGHLCFRKTGRGLHTVVLKNGFGRDPFVSCSLVDMYSRCENVEDAKRVFDEMSEVDLVSLNTMVWGYVRNGSVHEALGLVEKTRFLFGLMPNIVTWNTLISGFSQVNNEVMVKRILESMEADGIKPDTIAFTSIISGYIQNFRTKKAYAVFRKMLRSGLTPTSLTISSLLPGTANTKDLRRGKEIHGYSVLIGLNDAVYVKSTLIDMYAKCGSISDSLAIFEAMPEKTTATWNSMMFGCANHGLCEKLNHLSFTAALTACMHSGNIEVGENLFRAMKDEYGILPRAGHYACMVDLLGRKGRVDEAYELIQRMSVEPDMHVWRAFMGACRRHGRVDLAEVAAGKLGELEPRSSGGDVALLGLYTDSSRWGNVMELKSVMRKRKVRSFASRSWIDVL